MSRELTMPPLLPCPFCGGEARVMQQSPERCAELRARLDAARASSEDGHAEA